MILLDQYFLMASKLVFIIHHSTHSRLNRDNMAWDLPVTEDIAKREITLLLYPAMNNDDVYVVVSAVQASLNLN
jgi:dTDP-4-amino-4,6-dideoxygalactose transaminase